MKSLVVLGALCASVALATPTIDTASVSVRQDGGKAVIIEYTLNPSADDDGGSGIVTVDILTNAVGATAASVGEEHLKTLAGDVNRVVKPGKHKILWFPAKEGLPEIKLPAAQVTARVTLWPTDSPPTYWIIDLTDPGNRLADRYYTTVEQIPGTVTNILYKTDRLVLRRIPAKGVTWKMGGSTSYGMAAYHYVSFSYDYYMAVFEFTNSQYNHIRGTWIERSNDALPVTWNFENWRGNPLGASGYNWPANGHDCIDSGKVLARLRTATNGIQFDMSTEAEWEYACRAGTSTKYCNGDTEVELDKVAWYADNADNAVHEVGLKDPNLWGLYDMHGNYAEFCLDKGSKRGSDPVWDPVGPMEAEIAYPDPQKTSRIATIRGGGWWGDYKSWSADHCASYNNINFSYSESKCTVRLTLPLK